MSDYKETFFVVRRYILDLPGITLSYFRVYESIFQFWNKSLPCFLNNKSLAERSGVEIRQVQRALDFLEKHGEIIRTQRGLKRYLSCVARPVEFESTENAQACHAGHPPMSSMTPPPCHAGHPEYKEREYKELNKTKDISIFKKNELAVSPPKERKPSLNTQDALKQNPHNIPEDMIDDWISNRRAKKAPLTQTAWNRITKELAKCANPLDAFEQMVSAGWQGFKAEWVKVEKKSFHDNESTDWIHEIHTDLF